VITIPKTKGVGFSDATFDKQKILKELFIQHISIVNAIYQKKQYDDDNTYLYIDATAGAGKIDLFKEGFTEYPLKLDGSPLIFLEASSQITHDMTIQIYFIEQDKETVEKLRNNIPYKFHKEVNIICGKYEEVVFNILEKYDSNYGLIYIDPNGLPSLDFIKQLSNHRKMRVIDLLMNFNCTTLKRLRKSPKVSDAFSPELIQLLTEINKKYWYVTEPNGSWQFSFIYGSNSDCLSKNKKTGLHSITSKEGKDILYDINYTKNERTIEKPFQKTIFDRYKIVNENLTNNVFINAERR
jgi:three-Cys-motif partner protein